MRQHIRSHTDPIVVIKVIRFDRSFDHKVVVLEIESQDGKRVHTLGKGDIFTLKHIDNFDS